LTEGSKVTAVQYKAIDGKSPVVEWVFPPLECTINPLSAGSGVHSTGTGIPNYWIHQTHKRVDGGGDSDTFSINEDGEWRSLNSFPVLGTGDTVTVTQSQHEFSTEDERSRPVTITVT
jgi:hypothetical protein